MKKIIRFFLLLYFFVLTMISIAIEEGFNKNKGYFYYATFFYKNNVPHTGYILCQKYTFLWLPLHKRIDMADNEEELQMKISNYRNHGYDIKWNQIH